MRNTIIPTHYNGLLRLLFAVLFIVLAINIDSIKAMTEEEQEILQALEESQKTHAQEESLRQQASSSAYSSSNYPSIRTLQTMEESIATLAEEQARILAPGIYQKRSNQGLQFYQLALEKLDRQQENITCGARVLTIAKAIDMIMQHDEKITPETIHKYLEDPLGYKDEIAACKQQVTSINFEMLMQKNNNKLRVRNWLILGSQEEVVIPLGRTEEEELQTFEMLEMLPEIISIWFARLPLERTGYCFCSDRVSGHWFLIAIVRERNITTLWYIDPKNIDYDKYQPAHKFLEYIIEKKPRIIPPQKINIK